MKKLISVLLMVMMVFSVVIIESPTVFAATSGNYTYKVVGTKAEITKYNGNEEDVIIPDTLGGHKVSTIGNMAFVNKDNLFSVIISNNVKIIDYAAFNSCDNLRSVSFGSSVSLIGDNAFAECPLLARAYFIGNAPTLYIDVFGNSDPTFTVVYLTGKTGFGNPWNGYPTSHVAKLVPSAPKVNTITNASDSISGLTIGDALVFILYGNSKKKVKSYSGTFNSPLAKHLAVGTKVKVRVVNYAYPSAYTTKYVIPAKPVVSKINVNNIAIKGKATKGSMVYVKIYGKTYSGKASTSTGAFSIKVPKVLVEAAVQVYCKISGYKSQTVYINV